MFGLAVAVWMIILQDPRTPYPGDETSEPIRTLWVESHCTPLIARQVPHAPHLREDAAGRVYVAQSTPITVTGLVTCNGDLRTASGPHLAPSTRPDPRADRIARIDDTPHPYGFTIVAVDDDDKVIFDNPLCNNGGEVYSYLNQHKGHVKQVPCMTPRDMSIVGGTLKY